jgi:WD40 repeat protein
VRLWRAADGAAVRVLEGHRAAVHDVAFSPDGARIASASGDHAVRLWDVETGQSVLAIEDIGAPLWALAFSPDGRRLAVCPLDGTARVLDTQGVPERIRAPAPPGAP